MAIIKQPASYNWYTAYFNGSYHSFSSEAERLAAIQPYLADPNSMVMYQDRILGVYTNVTDQPVSTPPPPPVVGSTSVSPTGTIRFVSTDGNDTNSGSEISPFRTIQAAIDASSPNDTVMVKAGTYTEVSRRNPAFSGYGLVCSTPGLILMPAIGSGGLVTLNQNNQGAGLILRTGTHNVTIYGFEIVNVVDAGVWVASSPGEAYTDNLGILSNRIHNIRGNDNVGGVRPDSTINCLIDGNSIYDLSVPSTGVAINVSGVHTYFARNCTVQNNDIYNCPGNAIREKGPDPAKGLNVLNNRLHDCTNGYRIGGMTSSDVASNIVFEGNVVSRCNNSIRVGADLVSPSTGLRIKANTFDSCNALQIDWMPGVEWHSDNQITGTPVMTVSINPAATVI